MIIVSIISLLFSLFLQGLVSNFQSYTIYDLSIFSAVYMLLTLVVLQPYFESNKKFLILILIFGLLLDITYSNTFILCTCIFLAIFYLNKLLNFFFPYNLFTVNLFSILSMISYHVITFLFLIILNFDSYNFIILLKVIGCNLIMIVVYTSFMYYLIYFIYKKFKLKLIRE